MGRLATDSSLLSWADGKVSDRLLFAKPADGKVSDRLVFAKSTSEQKAIKTSPIKYLIKEHFYTGLTVDSRINTQA